MLNSLENLLDEIAPGRQVTQLYAAASADIIPRCAHSRRTWELLVQTASSLNLPINTRYCSTDHIQAAKGILSNSGKIVVVSWEHTNIPALVGWTMALAINPRADKPLDGIPQWHGNVFDQYWVVDLRGKRPAFSIYPQSILPTDCPFAREPNGKCPGKDVYFGESDAETDLVYERSSSAIILLLVLIGGMLILYNK